MWNSPRPTYIEIYLSAIQSNYRYFSDYVYPKKVIPVVKADAYGHGAVEVVGALLEIGASMFAVSLVEEALELRAKYPNIELLLMGPTHPQALDLVHEHNLIVTIYSHTMLEAIKHFNKPLRVHVKFDTGMHRLGFLSDEIHSVYEQLNHISHVTVEGLYTHFAGAEHDDEHYHLQRQTFHALLSQIKLPSHVHAANTEATLNDEKLDPYTTHVRVGLGLYGTCYDPKMHRLETTLRWHTKVASIKTIPVGAKVGYSSTYQASKEERIALLPVGYADGLWRAHQDDVVSIYDKAFNIVGRISMDQTTVRVDESVNPDDDVVLLGGPKTSVYDLAQRIQTIPNEIFTNLSKRVPRYYIK